MPEVVARILEIRAQHPLWGAPKIRTVLEGESAQQRPPAASTIGEILRHEGLTRPPIKRRRIPRHNQPLAHAGMRPMMSSQSTSRAGFAAGMAAASTR